MGAEVVRGVGEEFTAERARCARVFAEASKRPEEGFDEELVKAEVLMAMEKSDRDRERSMWRREVIVSHHRRFEPTRETEERRSVGASGERGRGGGAAKIRRGGDGGWESGVGGERAGVVRKCGWIVFRGCGAVRAERNRADVGDGE